ncbi:MAG: type II toxin-antitoxin system YafQ family toxin [Candidatus Peregrinibacteria bacterium]
MTTQRMIFGLVLTKCFERDMKRMERRDRNLSELWRVVEILRRGQELPPRYRNHTLRGDLAGREECHIEPDWLLTYRRRKDILILVMLQTGTHADLFRR